MFSELAYLWALNLAIAVTVICSASLVFSCTLGGRKQALQYGLLLTALMLAFGSPFLMGMAVSQKMGWSEVSSLSNKMGCEPQLLETDQPTVRESFNIDDLPGDVDGTFARSMSSATTPISNQSQNLTSKATQSTVIADNVNFSSAAVSTFALTLVPQILLSVWLAGCIVSALRFTYLLLQSVRLRRAIDADNHSGQLNHACKRFDSGGCPVVFTQCPWVDAPLTLGFLRPIIAVPVQVRELLAQDELDCVIAHEAAHVARRDTLAALLQSMVTVCFWWNPALWAINRRLNVLREQICDAYAVHYAGGGRTLAHAMVKIAEHVALRDAPRSLSLSFLSGRDELERRITRLLYFDDKQPVHLTRSSWFAIGSFGLAASSLFVPVLRGQSNQVVSAVAPSSSADPQQREGRSVTGTLWNPDRKPVPAARVWMAVSTKTVSNNYEWKLYETHSDDRGQFHFRSVPNGRATITAKASGLSYAVRHISEDEEPTDQLNQDLILQSPASMQIQILGENGKPVVGAKITGLRWKTSETDWRWLLDSYFEKETFGKYASDERGRIDFPDLPAGAQCIVGLSHPDYAEMESEPVQIATGLTSIKMQRGSWMVIEAINDETGAPVPNVKVMISGLPGTLLRRFNLGEGGSRKLQLRHSAYLTIRATHPELIASQSQSFEWYGPNDRRVTFRMREQGIVTGRVMDAETKNPYSGASLVLTATDGSFQSTGRTGSDGNYEIYGPVGDVEVRVTPSRSYQADRAQRVNATITANNITRIPQDLLVRRTPTVSGRVLIDGKPAPNTLVMLGPDGNMSTTGSRGEFKLQLSGREQCEYAEAISLTDKFSGGVICNAGQATPGNELIIHLEPDASLVGNVVSSDAAAIKSGRVYLYSHVPSDRWTPMQPVNSTPIKADGSYEFHGLNRLREYFVATPRSVNGARDAGWIQVDQDVVQAPPLSLTPRAGSPLQKAAPDIHELATSAWLNSSPVSLKQLRGKVVLIDFCSTSSWGSSSLQLMHEACKDSGLFVIGMHHYVADIEKVRESVNEQGITYSIAIDTEDNSTFGKYDVRSYPYRVLIDRNGQWFDTTNLNEFELLSTIRRLLVYGAP